MAIALIICTANNIFAQPAASKNCEEMMEIFVNGVTLFYEVYGQGEPMILLHGSGEDHYIFSELVEKLQLHYTVYAIDSRNHGNSQKTGDYAYEIMAEDIAAFIKALKLKEVNIIGFSDGAIISLLLAIGGASIHKMALLGVNLSPDDFTKEAITHWQSIYRKKKNPLVKLMLEQPQIPLDKVRNVTVPTFLVAAENEMFKKELYPTLQNTFPQSSLKIMTGHNHESYIVHQDMLYPDLKQFFA